MAQVVGVAEPREAIRAVASGVFDAIDTHPWVGTPLCLEPWQTAVMNIFEGFGRQLQVLGVPKRAQCDCAKADCLWRAWTRRSSRIAPNTRTHRR
ncbi:hypothetical protein FHT40_006752 [Mycolicibacterium sp. BK556]|nr:hypothetical protein [Mycolicibacterium sp. BK556]MBB3636838.1 hypothetical protein [Mycolicibacterium sp. BK607]